MFSTEQKAISHICLEFVESNAAQGGHSTGEIGQILAQAGYHFFEWSRNRLKPVSLNTLKARKNIWAFANRPTSSGRAQLDFQPVG